MEDTLELTFFALSLVAICYVCREVWRSRREMRLMSRIDEHSMLQSVRADRGDFWVLATYLDGEALIVEAATIPEAYAAMAEVLR